MKNEQTIGRTAIATDAAISGDIVQNHLGSFLEHDLEALMSDFTDESVLVTPEKTYTGLEEIRGYFAALMAQFPKQRSRIELDKTVISDDVAYIIWRGTSPGLEVSFATDTFVIKNGKIRKQTFAGQLKVTG